MSDLYRIKELEFSQKNKGSMNMWEALMPFCNYHIIKDRYGKWRLECLKAYSICHVVKVRDLVDGRQKANKHWQSLIKQALIKEE